MLAAPLFLVLILNIALLVTIAYTNWKTKRSNSSLRKPTIMLSMVTLIELVSMAPHCSLLMIIQVDEKNKWVQKNFRWFRIFAVYMISMNVWSNPLIYTAFNKNFRKYLRGMIKREKIVKARHAPSEFGATGTTDVDDKNTVHIPEKDNLMTSTTD